MQMSRVGRELPLSVVSHIDNFTQQELSYALMNQMHSRLLFVDHYQAAARRQDPTYVAEPVAVQP